MSTLFPRVSIGLPVYNAEKYLKEAIESILAQTFRDFELIILDNASIDKTQNICRDFARNDKRIKYFRNDSNIGSAPNHNKVYKLAQGEFFRWAGYDDKIAPEFLEMCVEYLDEHADVVLCIPHTRIIGENGEDLGLFEFPANPALSLPQERFRHFSLENQSGNYMYGLIRSSEIAKTSLHGSYSSSDLVFLAELTLYGKFDFVTEVLFFRRIHPDKSTVGVLASDRNRVVYIDTLNVGRILLPKWMMFHGYLRAIWRSPLNGLAKFQCYLSMARWAIKVKNLKSLVKDVLLASHKYLQKTVADFASK